MLKRSRIKIVRFDFSYIHIRHLSWLLAFSLARFFKLNYYKHVLQAF